MKRIDLTKDKYALVDDVDFQDLNQFNWCFTNNGYAVKHKPGTKGRHIQMHRVILQTPDNMDTDHINGNKLDNRRKNLRIATRSQNNANQKINSANTSGYKGVSWNKSLNYWTSYIKVNGRRYVKYSKSKEEAAKKYNVMALGFYGKFALLNKLI